MGTTLVTGGAGFIGSNFVSLLAEREPEERIIVLDAMTYAAHPENISEEVRSSLRFSFVHGDICNRDLVLGLMKAVDKVVHFAAESHVTRSIADDRPFFQTDVMGTQSIADAISRDMARIKRFVHISTSEVYGTAEYAPMDELHPLNPCTPYAAAKAGADRLVYAYRKTYNIPTVTIRPFNNYGPRQHLEKLVPRFITQALDDQPLTVHGDGRMTRDWIFVEDTCKAVYAALFANESVNGSIINVGTGIDVSVLAVAKMILDATGKSSDLIRYIDARPGQVDRHISSVNRSAALLDWKSQVALEDGIERTVRWYSDNRQWWDRHRGAGEVTITDKSRRLSGAF
jgi:dTDP-glucose 4,6-dehydratase